MKDTNRHQKFLEHIENHTPPAQTPEGRVPRVPNIDVAPASAPAPTDGAANNLRNTQYAVDSLPNPQLEISNPQSTSTSSFRHYLLTHARVPLRDNRHGSYGPFTFAGRAPLDFIVTLIDKILANSLHGQEVEVDGLTFLPGRLKGATITVGGGAQFGKTVLILNFQAFCTFIEFINFGYYTPDQELLAKIVDTKFRPDVLDQQPWMPNAGGAQPITQAVLDECRALGLVDISGAFEPEMVGRASSRAGDQGPIGIPYRMTFGPQLLPNPSVSEMVGRASSRAGDQGRSEIPNQQSAIRNPQSVARYAGLDTGPRCWFWCDELRSPAVTACVWAELIASGIAPARIPQLMRELQIDCLFIDAGGEPDLTKRLVLALNGLENYTPPNIPRTDLLNTYLGNIGNAGHGLTWDNEKGQWTGLRAAAVMFVTGEAKGIEHTIGFTQEGKIYPLIKCNRSESIQTAVNDFLTPAAGVYEQIHNPAARTQETLRVLRTLPRARLPQTCTGPGISPAMFDSHLLNLRKERDPATGEEDWITGVENHLGLAKVYARLAAIAGPRPRIKVAPAPARRPWSNGRGCMTPAELRRHQALIEADNKFRQSRGYPSF